MDIVTFIDAGPSAGFDVFSVAGIIVFLLFVSRKIWRVSNAHSANTPVLVYSTYTHMVMIAFYRIRHAFVFVSLSHYRGRKTDRASRADGGVECYVHGS